MGERCKRRAMPVAPLDAALVFAARKPPPLRRAVLTESPLQDVGTRGRAARAGKCDREVARTRRVLADGQPNVGLALQTPALL